MGIFASDNKLAGVDFLECNESDWYRALYVPEYILNKQQLRDNGFPGYENINSQNVSFYIKKFNGYKDKEKRDSYERCCRCGQEFILSLYGKEICRYHYGKKYIPYRVHHGAKYTCCNKEMFSPGCTTATGHVWKGYNPGWNGPYNDYYCTKNPNPDDKYWWLYSYGVYALDTEMCYTINGLEVANVTILNTKGHIVYDSLIKPTSTILDYNTRFSGIKESDLDDAKTLMEVQNDLLSTITSRTILIGHGLENDLRALKMVHNTVVDTSVLFKNSYQDGRPSLKDLTLAHLRREIQNDPQGHSSYVDAKCALDLVLYYVRKNKREVEICT